MSTNTLRFLLRSTFVLLSMLGGCASVPDTPVATPTTANTRTPLITYALSLQGAPYRYGEDSPERGFDCSGFVRHVYQRQGIELPRTAKDMAQTLSPVPKNAVQAGDLVFFNTSGNLFSHVGIYIDDARFIHAPSQRTGKVLVSSLKNGYWQQRFTGVRRPLSSTNN